MHSYIAIEGPIGVGKTTLTQAFKERPGTKVVLDVFDNPFLEDFYRERPGAAFRAQMFFLVSRFQQQLDGRLLVETRNDDREARHERLLPLQVQARQLDNALQHNIQG